MLSLSQLNSDTKSSRGNKVGTFESMLSGVASGLIAIPKGLFSLGASLLDLGVNSGKAAAVEQWFDDLTEFDEKAEATAAGKITELLVNIGVPGGLAFKTASGMSKAAMLAAKNGKYVKLNNPNLVKAADEALELTAKGKGRQFIAGALGGGLAEGVFVGDVKDVGSFGDLLGGPTGIDRSADPSAATEILNRVKFGTEGALFTGILGGTGSVIKKLANRNKQLDVANSKLDRWIDKVAGAFRARSGKTQEFFDIERGMTGARSADANVARTLSRELEVDIDKLFPPMKTMFDKQPLTKARKEFLQLVNDTMLSGKAELDDAGKTVFGRMDEAKLTQLKEAIRKFAANREEAEEVVTSLVGGLSTIRSKWADLFSELGGTLGKEEIAEFKALFGGKFKNYIGATYDVFQNKGLMPWNSYRPAAEAIRNARKLFQESYATANPGKTMSDLEADKWVENALNTADMPKGFRMDRPSDALFNVPDFFVNRTTLDDAVKGQTFTKRGGVPRISISNLASEADKKVFNELFGKTNNPMQTIIGGMSKLSLITRRNLFYKDLITKNDEIMAAWKAAPDKTAVATPMFARSEAEAIQIWGSPRNKTFRRVDVIDPAKTLDVGTGKKIATAGPQSGGLNPFGDAASPFYARNGVADALERTGLQIKDAGTLGQLYHSLILYPKGLSQIAKTILSPVTHLRNFVSAGAFAAANGIFPAALKDVSIDVGGEFITGNPMKIAYQALQTGLKGTRQQNELYQKLLKLGVVNSNVKLGDLTRLLEDVDFGSTLTTSKGMRALLRPLSRLKSVSQDLYTAEDDFWKIFSWAMEKDRIEASFRNAGVVRGGSFTRGGKELRLTEEFLEREAADIVKNNIPNYDYVSEFVKGLRKLPIGNFVSFPAEIARTGVNIVRRALREINEEITLPDGRTIKPFQTTGYTRLFGFTTTVAAVPAATVSAFQALYDVTDEEREAIRRYVAQWSKNSTILPIKLEDGSFKYIDFSHANAYDTLLRPLQSVVNAVQDGRTDQDGMMDDLLRGVLTSMSEFAQPFISESIWTEAVSDIIMRGGRTRDGFQVYNPEDNDGDKASKIMAHLVKAQMPFSLNQLKRLDQSIESVNVLTKGKFDDYGQTFEFGDEFAGLFGFRAVRVNPERGLRFKVADYQKGARDSRSLFTRITLKGGPIEPREIVDAYINANRALFDNKKTLKQDMDAARLLNISEDNYYSALDRISSREVNDIDNNLFNPMTISRDIQYAFADNAAKMGVADPLDKALDVIGDLQSKMAEVSLALPSLPVFENPLLPIMQDTPITPTSLNLPNIDSQLVSQQVNQNNYNNLTTTEKIALLFGGN
jgi:hypothetical protein